MLLTAIFAFFLPLGVPLSWLMQWLDGKPDLEWASRAMRLGALACLGAQLWLAHRTAEEMMFRKHPLSKALRIAFWELRMLPAYLPFIGHWFESRATDEDNVVKPTKDALRQKPSHTGLRSEK